MSNPELELIDLDESLLVTFEDQEGLKEIQGDYAGLAMSDQNCLYFILRGSEDEEELELHCIECSCIRSIKVWP